MSCIVDQRHLKQPWLDLSRDMWVYIWYGHTSEKRLKRIAELGCDVAEWELRRREELER